MVDDNPINVQLLEDILAQAGYGSDWSTTDPTAVAPLHTKWKFDIVLLDIRMPMLDGFGVMRQLKEVSRRKIICRSWRSPLKPIWKRGCVP